MNPVHWFPYSSGNSLSNFAPAEVETIRLIDQRQTQLLEDIDLLNARILALLEEYNPSKVNEEAEAGDDPPGKTTPAGPLESAA